MSSNRSSGEFATELDECRTLVARLEKRLALALEDQRRQEHINDNQRALLYKVNQEYEELLERNRLLTDELHCKNLYLSGIIEKTPSPMFTLDASLQMASCNPAAMTFFGLRHGISCRLSDVFEHNLARKIRDFAGYVLANDSPVIFEALYEPHGLEEKEPQQSSHMLELNLFPVPHVSGQEGGVCCLVRDLDPVREELAERVMQAQLVELGALSAGIAHEVNNPVNGVLNYLQLFQDVVSMHPESPAELAEHVQKAQTLAGRVAEVVQAVLTVVAPGSQPAREFRLDEALDQALLLLRYELRRNNIALHVDLEDSLPMLVGRPVEVAQIVQNLVVNAIQAHAQSPAERQKAVWLEASLDLKASQMHLCVRDNGPGLDPESLPRLFHPFVTSREQGTGLGLYLSMKYARQYGGSITAANAEQGGAVFTVSLPLHNRK